MFFQGITYIPKKLFFEGSKSTIFKKSVKEDESGFIRKIIFSKFIFQRTKSIFEGLFSGTNRSPKCGFKWYFLKGQHTIQMLIFKINCFKDQKFFLDRYWIKKIKKQSGYNK